ncbi:MAG: hypothetical protein ACK40K_03540, partial [Raineya sp.]
TLQANGEKLRFLGRCPKSKSVYFSRAKKVSNVETLEFPLPISPKQIDLFIVGKCKILGLKVVALPPIKLKLHPDTWNFIRHACEFAKKFDTLSTGIYTDDKKRFPIVLSEQIRNRDTGKVMNTPARVSRATGQIEVSREKFKKYTVPMRVFILLHERSHYELNSSNELECDLQALQWYLGCFFPQTEAIYANTKIFSGSNPEHLNRAEQLLDYIKNYNAQTATYDNGFCGSC